jgi:hypothetical protein
MAWLVILDSDQQFEDSPSAGHPLCRCSRCRASIAFSEVVLRVSKPKEMIGEWRFCEACQRSMGIVIPLGTMN